MTTCSGEVPQTGTPRPSVPQAASLQSVRAALDEASRAATRIEDGAERAVMLARVAVLRWRIGDAPGCTSTLVTALAGAGNIEDDSARALALARIARAQAQAGDRQGWRATAAEALASIAPGPTDEARLSALAELAIADAVGGDFTGASARTEQLTDGRKRDRTIGAIVSTI